MKVLSIGSDRTLFTDSNTLSRVREYSSKVDSYSIVVFALSDFELQEKNDSNLYLYPTNSFSRLLYVFDALLITRKILFKEVSLSDWVLTVQDPFESGFVGWMIKYFFKLPLQVQVHTDFLSDYFNNSLLNKIRLFLSGMVLKRADSIRVVSSVIKDSIVNKYPELEERIEILPVFVDINAILNFVPQKNIKNDYPNFDFIILMASRLSPEKRIDLAISALKNVVAMYPKVGLVICGSGSEKNKLADLAYRLGVGQNVVFKEWQTDLISYFKTSDIYLLTSEFEGYGMTLIEAGASGVPIVSTYVGAAKTDTFKNGYNISICKKLSPDSVSDEVMNLISDEGMRKKYSENVKIAVSSLAISKEEYIGRYIKLLAKLQ